MEVDAAEPATSHAPRAEVDEDADDEAGSSSDDASQYVPDEQQEEPDLDGVTPASDDAPQEEMEDDEGEPEPDAMEEQPKDGTVSPDAVERDEQAGEEGPDGAAEQPPNRDVSSHEEEGEEQVEAPGSQEEQRPAGDVSRDAGASVQVVQGAPDASHDEPLAGEPPRVEVQNAQPEEEPDNHIGKALLGDAPHAEPASPRPAQGELPETDQHPADSSSNKSDSGHPVDASKEADREPRERSKSVAELDVPDDSEGNDTGPRKRPRLSSGGPDTEPHLTTDLSNASVAAGQGPIISSTTLEEATPPPTSPTKPLIPTSSGSDPAASSSTAPHSLKRQRSDDLDSDGNDQPPTKKVRMDGDNVVTNVP